MLPLLRLSLALRLPYTHSSVPCPSPCAQSSDDSFSAMLWQYGTCGGGGSGIFVCPFIYLFFICALVVSRIFLFLHVFLMYA